MRVILEQVDQERFLEIVLTERDRKKLAHGDILSCTQTIEGHEYYIGVREKTIYEE